MQNTSEFSIVKSLTAGLRQLRIHFRKVGIRLQCDDVTKKFPVDGSKKLILTISIRWRSVTRSHMVTSRLMCPIVGKLHA